MNLLEIGKQLGITAFLHCNEMDRLVELAAGRDVLEVGSFMGGSAWAMGVSARSLLCVDTFRANSAGQTQMAEDTTLAAFLAATARYGFVKHWQLTSEEAAVAAEAGDYSFDMIFLDAMHTYEDVRADIKRWLPRVREGGVLAFHDYNHHDFPGVKQAVDEVFGLPVPGHVTITLREVWK